MEQGQFKKKRALRILHQTKRGCSAGRPNHIFRTLLAVHRNYENSQKKQKKMKILLVLLTLSL